MPETADFDAARVRLILRDLERSIGADLAHRPLLRLERTPASGTGVVVRGVATRKGMVLLGLRIARDAMESETVSLIDEAAISPDASMEGQHLRVIEVALSEGPYLEPERDRQAVGPAIFPMIGCFLVALAMIAALVVGFATIVLFFWEIGRRWLGG